MITAVDSNILLDIFSADKIFGPHSVVALQDCLKEGMIIASGVVLVETMLHFPSDDIFFEALSVLQVQPQEISMPAFLQAASAWQDYRRAGGSKNRVIADFLIGAHALVQCDRLLTRDRGFYRQYFKKLKIIEPKIK
jgi:predicted nucleic acid-binding protein